MASETSEYEQELGGGDPEPEAMADEHAEPEQGGGPGAAEADLAEAELAEAAGGGAHDVEASQGLAPGPGAAEAAEPDGTETGEPDESEPRQAEGVAVEGAVHFDRVVVLSCAGLGAGGDGGAHTIDHTVAYCAGLELPFLQWMGLGNASGSAHVPPADPPAASFATLVPSEPPGDATLEAMLGDVCEALVAANLMVVTLGALERVLGEGRSVVHEPALGPLDTLAKVGQLLAELERGAVVARVFASDGASPERGGPVAVGRLLEQLDEGLSGLLDAIDERTLLLVVGESGADGTLGREATATDERLPMLAYTPVAPSGVHLAGATTPGDLAASVAAAFALEAPATGRSFLGDLIA